MTLKKILKFFAITIITLSLLAVVLSIGINYFINKKLPEIINEKNDTDYLFSYKSIDFSVFNNTLFLNDVKVSPKNKNNNPSLYHYKADIKSIGVTGVDFYKLLKNKTLDAFTIHITNPEIIVYKSEYKNNEPKRKSKLPGAIDIDKISIEKANVKVYNSIADTLLNSVFNLNAKIDVLKMGEYIESKGLPFSYSNYEFKIDSAYTKINRNQYAKVDAIDINKSDFNMLNFRLLSENTNFNSRKEKSEYDIKVPKLNLKGTDWGFKEDDFYLNISQINIDSVNFGILNKRKVIATKTRQNKKQIDTNQTIPFNLNIDALNIKKSTFNSLNTFEVQNVNIEIRGINNQKNKSLYIETFRLNNPQISQVNKKKNNTKKSGKHVHFNDAILINRFEIRNANYILKNDLNNKKIAQISHLNLDLNQIKINNETVTNKIPFTYANSSLKTGKIYYDTGEFYTINSNGIVLNNNDLEIKNFELKPKMNQKTFNSKIVYGADLFNVSIDDIKLKKINWGFNSSDIFFVKINELVLNQINASIYRNASIPLKQGLNKLYSQKLRELKFGLEINKINIVNSNLKYEEENDKSQAPGILYFSKMNATIKNIYSGYNRKSGPTTLIEVNTTFMNQAKVGVNWSFNIMNKQDTFNIKGTVLDLLADGMTPFLKPYLNISATGVIDEVDFDFNGNNDVATGIFIMNYNHLKLSIYKHDGDQKRKLISALANLVVRKNTHGKDIEHNTKPVERIKNKGFFNFFWLNLKQGLKQTLL